MTKKQSSWLSIEYDVDAKGDDDVHIREKYYLQHPDDVAAKGDDDVHIREKY